MILYFAAFSCATDTFVELKHNDVLESYLYLKNKDVGEYLQQKCNMPNANLFLDSGAYSAFTRGEVIDIDKYAQFIKDNRQYIGLHANLDVIGDYEGTAKNQAYLEAQGLKPLATFHYGSPMHILEEMVEKYDYIALGGLVPIAKRRKVIERHLDRCFSIITKKNPLPKVHGFGVNAYWAWERYPFYSVDATSWQASGRFGEEYVFDGEKPVRDSSWEASYRVNRLHYKDRFKTSCEVLIKASNYITRLWESRGVTWT